MDEEEDDGDAFSWDRGSSLHRGIAGDETDENERRRFANPRLLIGPSAPHKERGRPRLTLFCPAAR